MKRERGHGDIEPDLGRLAWFEADFPEGFELLDRRGDAGDQIADIELRYGLAVFLPGVFTVKRTLTVSPAARTLSLTCRFS